MGLTTCCLAAGQLHKMNGIKNILEIREKLSNAAEYDILKRILIKGPFS
jgi:hypothetical protein